MIKLVPYTTINTVNNSLIDFQGNPFETRMGDKYRDMIVNNYDKDDMSLIADNDDFSNIPEDIKIKQVIIDDYTQAKLGYANQSINGPSELVICLKDPKPITIRMVDLTMIYIKCSFNMKLRTTSESIFIGDNRTQLRIICDPSKIVSLDISPTPNVSVYDLDVEHMTNLKNLSTSYSSIRNNVKITRNLERLTLHADNKFIHINQHNKKRKRTLNDNRRNKISNKISGLFKHIRRHDDIETEICHTSQREAIRCRDEVLSTIHEFNKLKYLALPAVHKDQVELKLRSLELTHLKINYHYEHTGDRTIKVKDSHLTPLIDNLKELAIHNCDRTAYMGLVRHCRKLETLSLTGKSIPTIGDSIEHDTVRNLHINCNGGEIPCIRNIPNLKYLKVDYAYGIAKRNKMSRIPPIKLETVHIDFFTNDIIRKFLMHITEINRLIIGFNVSDKSLNVEPLMNKNLTMQIDYDTRYNLNTNMTELLEFKLL